MVGQDFPSVMAGLDPAIHALPAVRPNPWMPVSSTGMTKIVKNPIDEAVI